MDNQVIINLDDDLIKSIAIVGDRSACIDLTKKRSAPGLDKLLIDSAASLALTAALLIDLIISLEETEV